MSEKRIRRTQAQVEALVAKVKQLIAAGAPATVACEQVGIQYQSYLRHKGTTGKALPKGQVQKLLAQLVEAIRNEVRQEIKASL